MANEECSKPSTSRYNSLIGKVAGYAIAILITICGFLYKNLDDRLTEQERSTSYLMQIKINREEQREDNNQMRLLVESVRSDLINRQLEMKNDIVGKIDLILPYMQKEVDKKK